MHHLSKLRRLRHSRGSILSKQLFKNEKCRVKVHSLGNREHAIRKLGPITACVFLIRNPRYAILSDFTRRTNNNRFRKQYQLGVKTEKSANGNGNAHTSTLNQIFFNFLIWQETKQNLTNKLKIYSNSFEACNKKIHILQYEKLKESPETLTKEISKVVDFIDNFNLDLVEKLLVKCLNQNADGTFHRKKNKDNNKTIADLTKLFNEDEKKAVNDRLSRIGFLFGKHNLNFTIPIDYYFKI